MASSIVDWMVDLSLSLVRSARVLWSSPGIWKRVGFCGLQGLVWMKGLMQSRALVIMFFFSLRVQI